MSLSDQICMKCTVEGGEHDCQLEFSTKLPRTVLPGRQSRGKNCVSMSGPLAEFYLILTCLPPIVKVEKVQSHLSAASMQGRVTMGLMSR